MNKTSILFLLVSVSIISCGTETTNQQSLKDSTTVSSSPVENDGLQSLLMKFREINEFPVVVDSVFLSKVIEGDTLTGDQLKLLATEYVKHNLNNAEYDVVEFYKIDSLKASGGYASYIDQLDIGMTKESSSYIIGKVKISDETQLLLWAIENSSYEACPYFSGTSVDYTLIHNNSVVETMIIGEIYGAGDPPVATERKISSTISKDGRIEMSLYEMNDDDMDAPQISITTGSYIIQIENGKSVFKKDETAKPKMINRPVETEY